MRRTLILAVSIAALALPVVAAKPFLDNEPHLYLTG